MHITVQLLFVGHLLAVSAVSKCAKEPKDPSCATESDYSVLLQKDIRSHSAASDTDAAIDKASKGEPDADGTCSEKDGRKVLKCARKHSSCRKVDGCGKKKGQRQCKDSWYTKCLREIEKCADKKGWPQCKKLCESTFDRCKYKWCDKCYEDAAGVDTRRTDYGQDSGDSGDSEDSGDSAGAAADSAASAGSAAGLMQRGQGQENTSSLDESLNDKCV